jgi:hypothetical protein
LRFQVESVHYQPLNQNKCNENANPHSDLVIAASLRVTRVSVMPQQTAGNAFGSVDFFEKMSQLTLPGQEQGSR